VLVTALLALAFALACSSPAEEETFMGTQAALAEKLGDPCPADSPAADTELIIDEQVPECEPGYCVTRGGAPGASEGQGICSCRCDGPEGTGPFCACSAGFVCEFLLEDVGMNDWPGDNLAGSYCMPE
jgi:hypothetical protein